MTEKTREEELEILLAESDLRVDTLEDRVAELESQCLNLAESNDALDNHNDELLEEYENLRAQLNAVVDEDLRPYVDTKDNKSLEYMQVQLDNTRGELLEISTKSFVLHNTLKALLDSWEGPKIKPFTRPEMLERPSTDPDTVYGTKG